MAETKKSESKKVSSIGIDVVPPKDVCKDDVNCPFHGELNVRGRVLVATVVKAKVPKMAVVEWQRVRKIPKYERYEKLRSRVTVHNPACINAGEGDKVKIAECRKISKTKAFVIVEKL